MAYEADKVSSLKEEFFKLGYNTNCWDHAIYVASYFTLCSKLIHAKNIEPDTGKDIAFHSNIDSYQEFYSENLKDHLDKYSKKIDENNEKAKGIFQMAASERHGHLVKVIGEYGGFFEGLSGTSFLYYNCMNEESTPLPKSLII